MTLLMFIWTVSCFRLMANTTSVSQGDPCGPAAFPFLPKAGVDVFVTESGGKLAQMSGERSLLGFCSHVLQDRLPLRGAEESDTLRVRPGAGDLRWPRPPGDMLLPAACSEKTLGDWGMCWAPVLRSHVPQ